MKPSPTHGIGAVLALALCSGACSGGADATGGPITDASTTRETGLLDGPGCDATAGRVPQRHQPAGTTCSQQRPAWNPTPYCTPNSGEGLCSYDTCFQDSDCTAGQNGRCGSFGGPAILGCSYDECFQNGDCDGGQACLCRPPDLAGPPSLPNVCVAAGNCRVDSDCGDSGYCSPSNVGVNACACVTNAPCDGPDGSGVTDAYPPNPPPGAGCYESSDGGPWVQVACTCSTPYPCGQGFYCHTACDQCVDDADCSGGACVYSLPDQRWECVDQQCPL